MIVGKMVRFMVVSQRYVQQGLHHHVYETGGIGGWMHSAQQGCGCDVWRGSSSRFVSLMRLIALQGE
ncbi:hypothetical protein XfCFBP8082_01830 [Xylella fastidiosa subsp. fastidiosa]|nr:hypothetical protein M233_07990 [Xylella fastidiosa subsp. multiplex Griffin-1]KAF0571622.1 hypothetical protein P305_03595 [Xylella fastidiosa subsp. fastidiosa Mus-1]KFA40550.1 hypothetical protein DF22_002760 [Xylella fastidiosa]RWA33753.1 hypothetical protein XfCFBP7969_02480 [Xylella fastidiosa subsp. fastidiosa]RWA38574.1 hypothetical protein XfCFBP8078_01550 [Xylella fastidiosa subsp. multiplex]RWA45512.1 hypothetical protein XfCFBP8356_00475 [Xylella fastidiosa subsp. sandyi]